MSHVNVDSITANGQGARPITPQHAAALMRYKLPVRFDNPVVLPPGVVRVEEQVLADMLGKDWQARLMMTGEMLERKLLLRSDFFGNRDYYRHADLDRNALAELANGPVRPEELAEMAAARVGSAYKALQFFDDSNQAEFMVAVRTIEDRFGARWRDRFAKTEGLQFNVAWRDGLQQVFFPLKALDAFMGDALTDVARMEEDKRAQSRRARS